MARLSSCFYDSLLRLGRLFALRLLLPLVPAFIITLGQFLAKDTGSLHEYRRALLIDIRVCTLSSEITIIGSLIWLRRIHVIALSRLFLGQFLILVDAGARSVAL